MVDINVYDDEQGLIITEELEIYVQQILMILNTSTDEVMGCSKLALDLERYVYETRIDSDALEEEILNKIRLYTTFYDMYTTEVRVSFAKGENREICLIDIYIDKTKMFSVVIN